MTGSLASATVVAYASAADIPGDAGHLRTLPFPGDNKSMRAEKGNFLVGFHCKLPRRGGSAVHRRVDRKQEEEFSFCSNDARMSLKTKDRCGKSWKEAGILLITKEISVEARNVTENTGDSRFLRSTTLTLCPQFRRPLTGPCRPSCHELWKPPKRS